MKPINQNHRISTKTVWKKCYREQIISNTVVWPPRMASINGNYFAFWFVCCRAVIRLPFANCRRTFSIWSTW